MEQPTGTVTFLLTDIEGSTRLWGAHSDAMAEALAAHDSIMREEIEVHRGYIFSTAGDSFGAAFSTAADAADAATAAQQRLAEMCRSQSLQIKVRMGLHSGTAHERDGNYFGPVVNQAARIMAAGNGGQVLLSQVTKLLLERRETVDLGRHYLKDLVGQNRLYQLQIEGLPDRFSDRRIHSSTPGNLPTYNSSFIGRENDINSVAALLTSHRLTTLIGPGGVGKTRLSVEIARQMSSKFTDGIWLVELAKVQEAGSVIAAVDTLVSSRSDREPELMLRIIGALADRRVLLILDNCEHLIDAIASLAETLLGAIPSLTILCTSREGLHVEGEQLWPVEPLNSGGADAAAVNLFLDRASEIDPRFTANDPTSESAIIEICRRLDGLPLGIELAAARIVSMTPADIRDRLDSRFRLLAGATRAEPRHQSLRQVVEWSYELLTDVEKLCFRRLSVFVDGFDLAAAVGVLNIDLEDFEILDLLSNLVRKCLVTVERSRQRIRYGMLETVRQYAADQLHVSDEAIQTKRQHTLYMVAQVRVLWSQWDGPGYVKSVEWLDANLANLSEAFRWSTEMGYAEEAAAIAAHSAMLGLGIERFEPILWAEEAVASAEAGSISELPRVLSAAGLLCYIGRPQAGVPFADRALLLSSLPDYDPFETAWTEMATASARVNNGDLEYWMTVCRRLASSEEPARSIGRSGLLFMLPAAGLAAEAVQLAETTLEGTRAHGNPFWIAYALLGYGRAFAEIQPSKALLALREAMMYTEQRHVSFWGRRVRLQLAGLELLHGDLEEGISLYRQILSGARQPLDPIVIGSVLASLAYALASLQRFETAAILFGVAEPSRPAWAGNFVAAVEERVPTVLGNESFERLRLEGRGMSLPEAIGLAEQSLEWLRESAD